MNAQQRHLARHALGLDNLTADDGSNIRKSYHNRFSANPSTLDARLWEDLVTHGDAIEILPTFRQFSLTKQGAEKALNEGETLDPDDFPN